MGEHYRRGKDPNSLTIDAEGAHWAWTLGFRDTARPYMLHGMLVGNPYQPNSPHWYFYRHGRAGAPFCYPMHTPVPTRQH